MAEKSICTIPACDKRAINSRGWCWGHYTRWRRHGDPLGGSQRAADGEPERFYREVVLAYDGDECLQWPYAVNEHGYGKLFRDAGMRRVPRLVCDEANGPPPTPDHEAAHSCGNGNKGCCTKRHLSWKTSAENKADMLEHGTRVKGERHGRSKLTENDVREIRALQGLMTQATIAKQFNISAAGVGLIHLRKKWAWLE